VTLRTVDHMHVLLSARIVQGVRKCRCTDRSAAPNYAFPNFRCFNVIFVPCSWGPPQ
jgi:hypothetical protein